jgi:hypothetical protein
VNTTPRLPDGGVRAREHNDHVPQLFAQEAGEAPMTHVSRRSTCSSSVAARPVRDAPITHPTMAEGRNLLLDAR